MPETRQGQFALSVAKWVEKAKGREDQVLRATCIGLLNNIVTRSPVGQPDRWKHPPPPGYVGGRFRANWQLSVGDPAAGTLDMVDPTGQVAVVKAQAVINGVKCGPPVYIVNNLPYAIPLEYGHSHQAENGMVRLAVVEFQQIVDKAARELQ